MADRPFAVFDIDGTIIRWQLYHALADNLARKGELSAEQYEQVRRARMDWKIRTSPDAFQTYEHTLVRLFDAAIAHIPIKDLQQACQEVIHEYKDQVYTYTRDLIQQLRTQNYLLFAISGSQAQIVEQLAAYYQFDDFGGSVYQTKDGRFTGHKELMLSERKPEYLKELTKKHQASWEDSIAVGDSEGDIPMLSAVEKPIVFNPTRKLFSHARKHHWPVTIERKNVIYRLEAEQNGTYKLIG